MQRTEEGENGPSPLTSHTICETSREAKMAGSRAARGSQINKSSLPPQRGGGGVSGGHLAHLYGPQSMLAAALPKKISQFLICN